MPVAQTLCVPSTPLPEALGEAPTVPLSSRDTETVAVREPAAGVLEDVPSSPLEVGDCASLPVPL